MSTLVLLPATSKLLLFYLLLCTEHQVETSNNRLQLDENEEIILGNIIAPHVRSSSSSSSQPLPSQSNTDNNDDIIKHNNDYYYGYRNDINNLNHKSSFITTGDTNVAGEQQQVPSASVSDDQYLIGVGIADATGPAADINMMGYAKPSQDSGGIHLRQFSRTIIIVDSDNTRIMYISIDNGMISQLLRMQVLKQLNKKYSNLYNENNVMMSASHSHSCPGGFFQFVLYNIPSQGFISQTLEALVSGIMRSVERAHNNMKLGQMSYIDGELSGSSINRSPTAYENNPEIEKSQYDSNTDNQMILIRMTDLNGQPIAMMNWFPVHATSMNNTNHLISGDNKGYASLLFEEQYNNGALPGKGTFVAIFAQANEGDVSPNTRGPRCLDTGLPCDSAHSTCGSPPRIYKRSRSSLHHQQQDRNKNEANYRRAKSTNLNYPNLQNQPTWHQINSASSQSSPIQAVSNDDSNRGYVNSIIHNNNNNNAAYFINKFNRQLPYHQGLPIDSDLYRNYVHNSHKWRSPYTFDTNSMTSIDQSNNQQRNLWSTIVSQRTRRSVSSSLFSSMMKTTNRSSKQAHQQKESTNEKCVASGPGKDMYESTKIIAYKQFNRAKELFDDIGSQIKIRGKIKFIHQHIDMSSQILAKDSLGNVTQRTCKPALGYSFAAGTTDGPGAFDFQQGDISTTPFWNMARDFLKKPSDQQVNCHHPKPVLFSTGEMNFPYAWHPTIVPTQIIMIGQLAIVGLPGEFTTMSGRRVRNAVSCVFNSDNVDVCSTNSRQIFVANDTIVSTAPVTDLHAISINNNISLSDNSFQSTIQQQDSKFVQTKPPVFVVGAGNTNNNNNINIVQPSSPITTYRQQTLVDINNNVQTESVQKLVPVQNQRIINKQDAQQLPQVDKFVTSPPLIRSRSTIGSTVPNTPVKVVLSGLSNIYTSYVTTFEEYQVQRYEGASTIYGPNTLQAYLNQFVKLAKYIKAGRPIDEAGPEPENLLSQQIVLKPGVIFDSSPYKKNFGDILEDVNTNKIYKCQDIVSASFVAGHPRNDLRHEGTFMVVERFNNDTKRFDTIASDSSWETKFIWQRTNSFLGESKAILEWDIPSNCKSGLYRLKHFGASKNLVQQVKQYTGQSSVFKVLAETPSTITNYQ